MSERNRKNRISLEAISNIDEDIIESATNERVRLLAILKKKNLGKRLAILLVAATLLLAIICGTLIALFGGGGSSLPTPTEPLPTEPIAPVEKQIPVYEGMTASKENPRITATMSLSLGFEPVKSINDAVKEYKKNDGSFTVSTNDKLFYGNANEDIYIAIHINNPDNYEILSFTFNGAKYSSYMFEAGSDMETIVIKVNLGDTKGIIEYTIDAIKYVDGTEIKDVRMEGDRTIKVGVHTENQPMPTVNAEEISYDSISFNVTVSDSDGILPLSDGKLYAVLYDGENIMYEKQLTAGRTEIVVFDELTSATAYQYAIIGVYDSFDGAKKDAHVLYEKVFMTESILEFSTFDVTYEGVNMSLVWNDDARNNSITSMAIYKGEEKVKDVDVTATSVDLLANTEYTLRIEYVNDGDTHLLVKTFKTDICVTPTLKLKDTSWTKNSVSFELTESDESGVGAIENIELWLDGTVIKTAENTELRTFNNLEKAKTYTVKVAYAYDLNDGNGERSTQLEFDIITQSAGLEVYDGEIWGLGDCTDTELCINMPISIGDAGGYENIRELYIGSGVTNLEFIEVFENVEKITVADGTVFEAVHLRGLSNINDLVIAEGADVKHIIAENCTALRNITAPSGVNTVEISDCTNLESLELSAGVTTVSLSNCTSLAGLDMPNTVTKFYLYKCTSIKSITVPGSVKTIGGDGTSGIDRCTALESIVLCEGVERLEGDGIFFWGEESNLKTVTIPKSLTYIESGNFQYMDIDTVYYAGTAEEFKQISGWESLKNEDMSSVTVVCSNTSITI